MVTFEITVWEALLTAGRTHTLRAVKGEAIPPALNGLGPNP